jgi:probable F420-dependent oxidoreductase
MHVGLFAPLTSPFANAEFLETLGRGAEERGFHSVWVPEHVVLFDEYGSRYPYSPDGRLPAPPDCGILEPLTSLAFLAACTRRIRLATGVCLLPQRNPVYAAKETANIDFLSGGRLDLGIGVGWLREEFEAVNVPFERRGARARAYVEVLRRLWCDEVSEYSDAFFQLRPCRMYPKPVQTPHPPLHFGGESDAALRRVADLGQGWFGFDRSPEQAAEGVSRLGEALARNGRTLKEVQVSISPYTQPFVPDWVPRYRDAGVDQLVLVPAAFDHDSLLRALDELAPLVAAAAG